jgi:hypothetical protein
VIPPAQTDFWERVADKVARLLYERETQPERAAFAQRMPHLAGALQQTSASWNSSPGQIGQPGGLVNPGPFVHNLGGKPEGMDKPPPAA